MRTNNLLTIALKSTIRYQTLLPASERLKTVNLTKSSKNLTKDYTLDIVGASTKEVYWLPVVSVNTSTMREQVLKYQCYVTDTSPTGKQGLSNL
jgi:hypothetical protein